MDIKEIMSPFLAMDKALKKAQTFSSKNGRKAELYLSEKQVFDLGDTILKISPKMELMNRLLVREYALTQGVDIFLPEEIQPEYCTDWFGVSIQEKISPCPFNETEIFSQVKGTPTGDFLKRFNFLWYGNDNAGVKDGQIRIYDWIADFAVRPTLNGEYILLGEQKELYNGRF